MLFDIKYGSNNSNREHKGNSIIDLPSSYVVLDLETTGLDPSFDDIIEIGALKIENNLVVNEYQILVKPRRPINDFIENLTGITNQMVKDSPSIKLVINEVIDFIGNSIIMGHNVHFDVNFIYDTSMKYLNTPVSNDLINTIRLSRKIYPYSDNHKLSTLVKMLNIKTMGSHRAIADCYSTKALYDTMVTQIIKANIDIKSMFKRSQYNAKEITTTNTNFDASHPLYNKTVVFTGILEKMVRKDAMQIVVDLGGLCSSGVTKKTNFLVLGNNDYCSSIKDGKSSKQKKAEVYILKGQDLIIISENIFYELIKD